MLHHRWARAGIRAPGLLSGAHSPTDHGLWARIGHVALSPAKGVLNHSPPCVQQTFWERIRSISNHRRLILLWPSTRPRISFRICLHYAAGGSWQSGLARELKPVSLHWCSPGPVETPIAGGIWMSCMVISVLEKSGNRFFRFSRHRLYNDLRFPSFRTLVWEKVVFRGANFPSWWQCFKNTFPICVTFKASLVLFPCNKNIRSVFFNNFDEKGEAY